MSRYYYDPYKAAERREKRQAKENQEGFDLAIGLFLLPFVVIGWIIKMVVKLIKLLLHSR